MFPAVRSEKASSSNEGRAANELKTFLDSTSDSPYADKSNVTIPHRKVASGFAGHEGGEVRAREYWDKGSPDGTVIRLRPPAPSAIAPASPTTRKPLWLLARLLAVAMPDRALGVCRAWSTVSPRTSH